jgi:hypothetical protein
VHPIFASLASICVLGLAAPASAQETLKPFGDARGAGGDFGQSFAIDGDTIVVGTPDDSGNGTGVNPPLDPKGSSPGSGAAHVFVRSGGAWVHQAWLKASNTGEGDHFGSSVAISGNTIAIGAPNEDSGATGIDGTQQDESASDAGAVYVFVRNGSTWTQQAYIKASNTREDAGFGNVALSGDTLAVGSLGESSAATGIDGDQQDTTAPGAGAAYVFKRTGTTWAQQAYIKASNTGAGDSFGLVALDGDTLAVGATGERSNATGIGGDQTNNDASDAGAVYVFRRTADAWAQEAYIKASNTDAGDQFGAPALSGNTLVVTAPGEDSSATGVNGDQENDDLFDAGAAYVFVRDGSTWTQQAYVKASNSDDADALDTASIFGNTMVLGASGEASSATGINGDQTDNSTFGAGAAYLFERSGGTWTQKAYIKHPTDASSGFVGSALSAQWLVIGSPLVDEVTVYDLDSLEGDGGGGGATEAGVLELAKAAYSASEGKDSVSLMVTRKGGHVGDVSVAWSLGDGTATGDFDYVIASGVVNIPDGKSKASFSVLLKEDAELEGDETFAVTLSAPTNGATLGTLTTATVTIVDNETEKSAIFAGDDSEVVKAKLKGPGTLVVTELPGKGGPAEVSIEVDDTDETSSLVIKVSKGDGVISIAEIDCGGPLKSLSAKGVDVTAPGISVNGWLGALVIRDLGVGAGIEADGEATQKTKISARDVGDETSIKLGSALAALSVARIGDCSVEVPSAGALRAKGLAAEGLQGDFGAEVSISGERILEGKLALSKLAAKGELNGAIVDVGGAIGSVSAERIVDTTIFASFTPAVPEAPLDGGFFDPLGAIKSVKVSAESAGFANSFVAAFSIGTVKLASVTVDNEGVAFGVIADPTGVIKSVTVKEPVFEWNEDGAADQGVGNFHVVK